MSKNRFLLSLLASYLAVSAQAAIVSVNGKVCGNLKELTVTSDSDINVLVDGECFSIPEIKPVPVVEVPRNTRVVEATWPNMTQKTFSLRQDEVLAIRIKTTASGVVGKVATAYTSGNSGNRVVALATQAGNFDVPKECKVTGTQSTTNPWFQGNAINSFRCQLPANSEAWINIKHVYCEGTCEFYLKTY